MNEDILPANVQIGHVHLRVADLDRATTFYSDVLGFPVTVDGRAYGLPMTLLAAGGYHHHIALNTFTSKDGTPPPRGHTGLHHFALLYPDREAWTQAIQRLIEHNYPVDDARDHGATVSAYLTDPDGNGIELYYDRPRELWFDAQGRPNMQNTYFDLEQLFASAIAV